MNALKKIFISFFILSMLFININSCIATSPENKEGGVLFTEIKKVFDENIVIYYDKACDWFKENIEPKLKNAFDKIISKEEYLKEKEEVKNELPCILEKISNFFKSLKN